MALFERSNTVRVSWKWASKKINCTLEGILAEDGCKGVCCYHKRFYMPDLKEDCKWLSDKGCVLSERDRPARCLLYPFMIKNNTMVLHGRALILSCKKCYEPDNVNAKGVFENMRGNLVQLLGEEQYEKTLHTIKQQKDAYITLPDWYYEQVELEAGYVKDNVHFEKRKLGYEKSKSRRRRIL